jgi:hypothetical protein
MRPTAYRAGQYRLELRSDQHLPRDLEVELIDGQTTELNAVVERARSCRISLVVPPGVRVPERLSVRLRREGPADERTIELYRGEALTAMGLGTYVAEVRDEAGSLSGSVRFAVGELQGQDLQIQLPVR